MPSNSKSYYNQPDYSGEESSQTPAIQKPNEISASDLAPPPPYSPVTSSSKNARQYDAVRDSFDQPQEQVGLLSQNQPLSKRDIQSATNRSNPHLELPMDERSFSSNGRRGDPGCCRHWCKYIFLLLILSLVLYKISDKFAYSDPILICPNGVSWQSMPTSINFSRNIEFIMEGSLTHGEVTVVPLEDRHGGLVTSSIQVYPPHLQDDMSYEIEQPDDDTVRVHIQFPFNLLSSECVNAEIEVRVPYSVETIRVHAQNSNVIVQPFVKEVKTVDIKTTNGDIDIDHWKGDYASFVTKDGDLKSGALSAKDYIYLESANGVITMNDQVIAKRKITVKNNNGDVYLLGRVEAGDSVDVESSNAQMQLSEIAADRVFVQNGNGWIQVDSVEAKEQITVKTSNAPIDVSVVGEKNNKVTIISSNANVDVYMTHEFEGHFVMSTSEGSVNVVDNEDEIEYQDNLDYLKRGNRKGFGNKGDLTVQTSNADVSVSFIK